MTGTDTSRILEQPIHDASAWTPASLLANREWEFEFSSKQVNELKESLAAVRRAQLPLPAVTSIHFPLPGCQQLISSLTSELKDGRGMALLHGFPVGEFDLTDLELMYWGFCSHLGTGLTQNSDATLIHYVTEGILRPNQGDRPVGNPGMVPLHVDLADIVTLLCVRQPSDSPQSKLVSSTSIYNRILQDHAHLLPRLYRGFQWDRQNEQAAEESAVTDYSVPVFSHSGGQLTCRFNIGWILPAAKRLGHKFDDEEKEILQLMYDLSEELAFAFDFNPGDVQFANNYTVMHGREGHKGGQTEEETRLLMRIWLNTDGFRDFSDESIIRYGVMRHGKLGWTAAQMMAGIDGKRHARRDDLAPLAAE